MEPIRIIKTTTAREIQWKRRKHTDSTKSISQTSLASSKPQSAQYTSVSPAYGNSRPRKLLYIASFKLTVATLLSPGHLILHCSPLPTARLDRQPSVVVVKANHRARNSTHHKHNARSALDERANACRPSQEKTSLSNIMELDARVAIGVLRRPKHISFGSPPLTATHLP